MREKYVEQLKGLKEDFIALHEIAKKTTELIQYSFEETKINDILQIQRKSKELDWNVRELGLQIEENCIRILSTQQPLAKDLRLIFTILKSVTDFQRITRDTFHALEMLADFLPSKDSEYCQLIKQIAESVEFMMDTIADAIKINATVDAEILSQADTVIDKNYELIICSLENEFKQGILTFKQVLALGHLARYLERVGDHICNIGERWYYTIRGKKISIK
ncbi:MAG: phosphate signaling complex PhoU family protein [Candidatus Heimdallarchaeaceae archaeon]